MLRWFEHSYIYAPSCEMELTAADLNGACRDIYFETDDALRLNGWFFPAHKGSSRSHLVFLVMHGNAGNICHRIDYCQAWLELGVNVFLFDYRGYGRSQGRPDEQGTYLDAQAACHWLRKNNFAPDNIIPLGKSLGGGIGSELALREQVGGLILQNSFTSVPDVGAEVFPWLPVRWICRTQYNTHSKLPRIHLPVLIAHSRDDRVIPFHHGQRNFAVANHPKMFLELSGPHNGTLQACRAQYLSGLEKFLSHHFK